MLNWLFLNTFVPAIIPILLVLLIVWLFRLPAKWASLLRDGQLCFYCTSISTAAISDLVSKDASEVSESMASVDMAIFGILLCMMFSTFAYGVTVLHDQVSKEDKQINLGSEKSGFLGSTDSRLASISVFVAVVTTVIVATSRRAFGML